MINISFKITQKNFEEGMKLHAKKQAKNMWIFILFMSGAFFLLSTDFESSKSVVKHIVMVILFPTFYWFFLYFLQRFQARRQYRTNSTYQHELHYTLDDEGVKVVHFQGNSFLKWKGFGWYIENESTYLLYLSPYLMYILPKNIMSEEENNTLKKYLDIYVLNRSKVSKKINKI